MSFQKVLLLRSLTYITSANNYCYDTKLGQGTRYHPCPQKLCNLVGRKKHIIVEKEVSTSQYITKSGMSVTGEVKGKQGH